jgi:enamine deaminase RidA (YjgF/YER057c/UK114 family)
MSNIYSTLERLHITLPPLAKPAAAYQPFCVSGSMVYLSGHIAKKEGLPRVGQLGLTMNTEEGQAAARSVAIDLMGTLQAACQSLGHDLEAVKQIVKVTSLVNSTPEFTQQHLVTNGCSELFAEVFESKGLHARSAFGVVQLPMGACVEIEMIVELNA